MNYLIGEIYIIYENNMNKRDLVKLGKEWSTHMPLLIKIVQQSQGTVMEIGSGIFSTPLLHWLCRNRKLITYENIPEYYDFARKFKSRYHSIRFINNWNELNKIKKHFGVVFIDHDGDRADTAIKFKDKADYIIIHDSNVNRYGYEKIWKQFKYRYDWKDCKPWTSVLSNFDEL